MPAVFKNRGLDFLQPVLPTGDLHFFEIFHKGSVILLKSDFGEFHRDAFARLVLYEGIADLNRR